jgi:hypothetical protein
MVDEKRAQYAALKRGYGKSKRFVPAAVLKHANLGAKKTLKTLLQEDLADSISVYDNSGLNQKLAPKIIVQNSVVKDDNHLKTFLKD